MARFRTLKVLCLVAGLLFVSPGISKGIIFLRVDGDPNVSLVTLQPGESRIIEIYSTDINEYEAFIGFEADPLATFVHIETRPEAGPLADFFPESYGYYVWAMGFFHGDVQPGVHFVFQYTAATPGQVMLGLWNDSEVLVDSVLITVEQPRPVGACCDSETHWCAMTTEENCPFTWVEAIPCEFVCQPGAACGDGMCNGTETCYTCPADCGECPPPPPGACCDANTGDCYTTDEGYCRDSYTWLGYGSSCSSCVPSVEVRRFEINQCFQQVAGIADQNFVLIETKPFVARVTLKATTPGAKSIDVKLKVENIGEKDPERPGSPGRTRRPANPITIIDPATDPCATCDFFFLDTENMKASTYKFSLVVKDSGAEIWTHNYQFKSSKTFKILVVPELVLILGGVERVSSWQDSYMDFLEQVYPIPTRNAKGVNHLERENGVRLFGGRELNNMQLFNVLNVHLNRWNQARRMENPDYVPADRICAVVPHGTVLGTDLGQAWENAVIIVPGADAEYTLGHEIGHTPVTLAPANLYLGDEYVTSDTKDGNGRWVLNEWFRFDHNPPPLDSNLPGPFEFIIRAGYPNGDKLCKWAANPDSYGAHAPHQFPPNSVRCAGRYVGEGGYVVKTGNERKVPSRTLSMMSGGSGFCWISGPEYKSLIALLAPPAGAAAALPAGATILSSDRRMLISGIIDINEQTAEISPLVPVPNLELTPEANDPNCRLVFKSSTEEVLDSFNFNFVPIISEDPNSLFKGPFSVVVDLPDDTARIQVTIEAVVADELQLTDNSPNVTVISPNGGEEISGEMAITWSASDPDSNDLNDLSYTVEFSHDNGGRWDTIIIDHNDDELTVDSNYLPGGPNCLVKVIASDGWNRAEDISDAPFSIATKPPRVTILDPEDGTILLSSESIQGRCIAYDPETGDINDPNAIVWSSNIDGFLGNGDLVGFELSPGDHILTATASDPEAKTGIDTVRVRVLANASDFNCDFRVNFIDLATLANKWQATCCEPNWCEGTDLDRSCVVDFDDLCELCENWLWQME